MAERPETRPAVSVVVPFHGDDEAAKGIVASLGRLALAPGDEIIVADNTDDQVLARHAVEPIRPVAAAAQRSSYYARNVGADQATNDWLLFLDADCIPPPGLLDAYLADPVADDVGAIAGQVVGVAGQDAFAARYARSRRHLEQANMDAHVYRPMAVTANLLVRRAVWNALGGFQEGIRSAGDSDFSWRLQDAGWRLEYRGAAVVEHRHRTRVRPLLRQAARYGAGRAWVGRRYERYPRPRLVRELARSLAGLVIWPLTGRLERGLFKGMDGLWVLAESIGSLFSNVAAQPPLSGAAEGSLRILMLVDVFPEPSETFVVNEAQALARQGHHVRLEAGARARLPNRSGARGLRVNYLEDDGLGRKALDLAWLLRRHPLRCLRDLAAGLRHRREEAVRPLRSLAPCARRLHAGGERHIHAHFAAGASLDALRLSRLLGVPFSVTAHAYDIFQHPRNLQVKLDRAAFVTTGCDYNVRYLKGIAARPERVHRIVMGIDGERFKRRRPPADGRTVIAIGRLVEKKGFSYLLDAVTQLHRRGAVDRLVLVGDGPLGGELRAQARSLGIEDAVEFRGTLGPAAIHGLLEQADVLAMPCVVAADGDRDSMPVVVKEALAMEVPVVASDEVGLPEIVQKRWGRLVPPGDPDALAEAIEQVLALPLEERREMGRLGRAFVIDHANVDTETAKLARLIADPRASGGNDDGTGSTAADGQRRETYVGAGEAG